MLSEIVCIYQDGDLLKTVEIMRTEFAICQEKYSIMKAAPFI